MYIVSNWHIKPFNATNKCAQFCQKKENYPNMSATMIEPEIQNELNKAMQKSLIRVKI